jgi:hypothetical protein
MLLICLKTNEPTVRVSSSSSHARTVVVLIFIRHLSLRILIARFCVGLILIVTVLVDLGGLLRGELRRPHRVGDIIGVFCLIRLVLIILFVIRDIVVDVFITL